jgi:Uma2 family endonuclease
VSVYRADGTEQTLSLDDTLSGEDVLPGFELPLRRISRPVRSL